MNITLITPGGVDKSGRERVVPALLWLIERLTQEHKVLVIALHQYPEFTRYRLLGADVVNLGLIRGRVTELKLLTRLRQLRHAFQLTHHQPDLIHIIGLGESGLLGAIASRLWRVPALGSIWSGEMVWLPDIQYGGQKNWRTRLPITLTRQFVKTITGGSHYVLHQLQGGNHPSPVPETPMPQAADNDQLRGTFGNEVPLAPAYWLPLGVDTAQFTPLNRPFGPPWRFVHVANLNPVKDQSMLLRAMCRLMDAGLDFHLDVVGFDTLRGRVQIEARILNLTDRVHFYGYKPVKQLIPFYQRAHLFLQSSLHESQGVALLEAAATGVPTVGTAVGLVPELAPTAAVAVPPGDDMALATAILAVVQNKNWWSELGAAAAAFAHTYNADWTAQQFQQLYAQKSRASFNSQRSSNY